MIHTAKLIHFILLLLICTFVFSFQLAAQNSDQNEDAFFVKSLFSEALQENNAFQMLERMINSSGARMSGSENYKKAVDFFTKELSMIGFDTVYHQPCKVPLWVRGENDRAELKDKDGNTIRKLNVSALGRSCSSPEAGVKGRILAFDHIDSVGTWPREEVEGNIVYFNRPMDAALLSPFSAYGRAADQRVYGPAKASQMGAAAALTRSLSNKMDYVPHTGVTVFGDSVECIPAMAVSTLDAEYMDSLLDTGKELHAEIFSSSHLKGTGIENSVIAEIKGSTFPDEIILAGGHLDSWDLGDGAHDDGSGCVHAVEAFRLLLESGYVPQRTWRCVLFASEESGVSGGKEYARLSNERKEFHLAAIESDAGGHIPRAFSFAGEHADAYARSARRFWDIIEPYDIVMEFSGGGADISRLRPQGGVLIGLRTDAHRYFDYHHSESDVIENVHPRELSMGAASMASLIYLIDKYGLSQVEEPD